MGSHISTNTITENSSMMQKISEALKQSDTSIKQQEPTPTSTSYIINNTKLGITAEYTYIPAQNTHLVMQNGKVIAERTINEKQENDTIVKVIAERTINEKQENDTIVNVFNEIIAAIKQKLHLTSTIELMAVYERTNRREK